MYLPVSIYIMSVVLDWFGACVWARWPARQPTSLCSSHPILIQVYINRHCYEYEDDNIAAMELYCRTPIEHYESSVARRLFSL